MAAGLGVRHLEALRNARRRVGAVRYARDAAPDEIRDGDGAGHRLHPHRPRHGPGRPQRGAEVRAAQRLAAAGVAGGRPDGHLAGRLGRHRNRLRHQWRRAAGLDVHPARRLPHDAGADPDLCADLHRPDPGRRPDQRLAGPPRASRLMSTVLSSSLPAAPRGDRLARAGRRFGLIVLALLTCWPGCRNPSGAKAATGTTSWAPTNWAATSWPAPCTAYASRR
ncbi:hypothetical protein G6F35_013783 [Rhizopus arrhizus]|nr:hypothetical protein G6F35_013783 [Rhizopus arrhizus]